MSSATASIRELRTDFRSVKRKVEEHGEVTITDRGEAAYVLRPAPPLKKKKNSPPIDYYKRLLQTQPKPIPAKEMDKIWEEERGDR